MLCCLIFVDVLFESVEQSSLRYLTQSFSEDKLCVIKKNKS